LVTNRSCLVTGSRGFVGRHLVVALSRAGYAVGEADIENGCDLTDWNSFKKLNAANWIIHLAARTFVPESFSDPRRFYDDNIRSTLNALEMARRWNARFILASSYVYGMPHYLPIDEAHPLAGENPYSQSKILCEQLADGYARHFGVPVICLRIFNIYGPGQSDRFLIPSMVKQAKQGHISLGDPEPRRDYVYVDDVVAAYMCALDYESRGCEVFNIGSGTSHSVREIVETYVKASGRPVDLRFSGKKRKGEISDTRSDCRKANRMLGWSAKIDLFEGLQRLVESN